MKVKMAAPKKMKKNKKPAKSNKVVVKKKSKKKVDKSKLVGKEVKPKKVVPKAVKVPKVIKVKGGTEKTFGQKCLESAISLNKIAMTLHKASLSGVVVGMDRAKAKAYRKFAKRAAELADKIPV